MTLTDLPKKILSDKRTEVNQSIKKYHDDLKSFNLFCDIQNEIKTNIYLLNRARLIDDAISKVSQHYKWEQYCLAREMRELNSSYLYINNMLVRLDNELLEAIDTSDLDVQLSEYLVLIGSIQNNIIVLQKEKDICTIYKQQNDGLLLEYNKYKIYEECLKSHSLKIIAITKTMDILIQNVNILLNEVSDFQLDFELKENSLEIFIIEENGFKMMLRAASGYQTAVISICFRLSLTSMLGTTAEFIILDEPLQGVDAMNTSKIQDMLFAMVNIYRFVFIITHKEELKEIINIPIHIKDINGNSFIGKIKEQIIEDIPIISDDLIYCDHCKKTLKKRSYVIHLKSKLHNSTRSIL